MLPRTVLINLKPLLTKDQFLLPSKPIKTYSSAILVVLLPPQNAEPALITVYSPLVMEQRVVKDISSSKTRGEPAGVSTAMSKSLIVHLTFAVS